MKILAYILYALILLYFGVDSIHWVMQKLSLVQYTIQEVSSGGTAFYIIFTYAPVTCLATVLTMKAIHSNHLGIHCAFLLLDLIAVPLSTAMIVLYNNSLVDIGRSGAFDTSTAFGAGVLFATCAVLNLLLLLLLRAGKNR